MAGDTFEQRPKLPEEILLEIFLRSSVESLVRAKCVCKQWYALIKNPVFVLDHARYQKFRNKGRLLLKYLKDDTKQYNFALFDDESLVSDTYHNVDSFHLDIYGLHMEGPINGVYCFFTRSDRIVLWNPALRESKDLPLPHCHFLPHLKFRWGVIGLGEEPLTHDLKLVLISRFRDHFSEYFSRYVSVYNLATNSWRLLYELTDLPLLDHETIYGSQNSSFLNGVYYWWTGSDVLIGFDMGNETFREISGPNTSQSKSSIKNLTLYNEDKVALMIQEDFSFDIWVMIEEGVWTKQISVTSLPWLRVDVGIWKKDEVLFATYSDLPVEIVIDPNAQMVLCNVNSREMRTVGPNGAHICFKTFVYYESLVSVNNGSDYETECVSLDDISDFLYHDGLY